ncbi:acyl carrier protein [Actinocrispum wychmicini]|uniref:Clorobiocin biosynthesis protein CloN5 n=1 Tax=Actinocrispum wychmicini TaxID=1213861 RepID=A0A4R2JUU3_9PSEU|nr:acyl carrier protein [Actinocrispum wychmicini]TCO60809.1 clorobiocin biosynthesis protein CloN5 [Actinocrispum wychmicini]
MDELTGKIVTFIRESLLTDVDGVTVDADTQLLEMGLLDSLKTAILLNYIRDEIGTPVPPAKLTSANFASPRDIAATVRDSVVDTVALS